MSTLRSKIAIAADQAIRNLEFASKLAIAAAHTSADGGQFVGPIALNIALLELLKDSAIHSPRHRSLGIPVDPDQTLISDEDQRALVPSRPWPDRGRPMDDDEAKNAADAPDRIR